MRKTTAAAGALGATLALVEQAATAAWTSAAGRLRQGQVGAAEAAVVRGDIHIASTALASAAESGCLALAPTGPGAAIKVGRPTSPPATEAMGAAVLCLGVLVEAWEAPPLPPCLCLPGQERAASCGAPPGHFLPLPGLRQRRWKGL